MTPPAPAGALPCGADLEELTAQVVERTAPIDPEHQAGCPYCRAAIAEL
nr:Asp23/Gls24 family envelope stress response protein [Geodermatophilaceae bacterium]